CEGLGVQRGASEAILIRDPARTLRQGAIAAWPALDGNNPFVPFAEALASHAGFSLDTPYDKLEPGQNRVIFQGTWEREIRVPRQGARGEKGGRDPSPVAPAPSPLKFQYKGLMPALDEASRLSWVLRHQLDSMLSEVPCTGCQGSRLRDDAAACRFQERTLGE